MLKWYWPPVACIIVAIILSIPMIGCMEMMLKENERRIEARDESYRTFGERAHKAGVPANANPYVERVKAELWLEGWLRSQEGAKK